MRVFQVYDRHVDFTTVLTLILCFMSGGLKNNSCNEKYATFLVP